MVPEDVKMKFFMFYLDDEVRVCYSYLPYSRFFFLNTSIQCSTLFAQLHMHKISFLKVVGNILILKEHLKLMTILLKKQMIMYEAFKGAIAKFFMRNFINPRKNLFVKKMLESLK